MIVKRLLLSFLLLFSVGNSVHADQNDFGNADTAVPALSQFEYMRGIWDVTIHMAQEDGTFIQTENKATVRAFYHPDGRSFQTIFSTTAGGFTTDIRTYNIEVEKWQILFMNARAQRWHKFEAEMVDDTMQTFVEGGYSGSEPFDIKIIDKNIDEQKFTKEVYRRAKGEQNWRKIYIMEYVKKPATN